MTNYSPTLAFIPARGGSKGIPMKNLAMLGGKPLIAWTLQAAMLSDEFDRIVVSTDHDLIRRAAMHYAGNDPRLVFHDRPDNMTDGLSYSIEELTLDYLDKQFSGCKYIVLLQPSSPFIRQWHIIECISHVKMNRGKAGGSASSAQTIVEIPHNYHYLNQRLRDETGKVCFKFHSKRLDAKRKQDKEAMYKFGNLVAVKTSILQTGGRYFQEPSQGIEIDWYDAIDIDSRNDLEIANILVQAGYWKENGR